MFKHILGMFFGFIFLSCTNKEEKIRPMVTDITESVYSSITIQPDSLYHAYALAHGILDKNLVEEGLSLLVVTHDIDFANRTDRNYRNGRWRVIG